MKPHSNSQDFFRPGKSQTLRILGIDPGFGRMGWGVIEGEKSAWDHVAHGCVETEKSTSFIERLLTIHSAIKDIVRMYHPDRVAVEELFFSANAKTALQVGQARGVILLTAVQAGLPVDEMTPLQVKQAMTGYGRADKRQVQVMVQMLLHLPKKKIQDDAADALAVALSAGVCLHITQKLRV